jgi:hypothetical protein
MIIKCPNDFGGHADKWKVFLAGPIQGAPKWQDQLPDLDNVVWISPLRDDSTVLNDETHKLQMEWETQALRTANIILFWIPEEVEHIEGRGYAQTTRFELGENLGRGKRIILGAYEGFPGRQYLEYKSRKYETIHGTVFKTLDECVNALKIYTSMCEKMPQIYNVNDAEFEKRIEDKFAGSFMEQDDWRKIEKWNTRVNPCDRVYHFGHFGYDWPLNYLTGDIIFYGGQELKL